MWYERSIENESNETNTDSAKPKLGSNQETQKKAEPVKSTPTGNEALTGLYVDQDFYEDEFIEKQKEVQRLTKFLNLLSHENIFIAEHVAILLANVSNSPLFRYYFITDRTLKALV